MPVEDPLTVADVTQSQRPEPQFKCSQNAVVSLDSSKETIEVPVS